VGATDYLRFLAALGFVLGLIGILAWIAARYRLGSVSAKGTRRLAIVEALPIDPRRKLVLIRCDDREYLMLLGQDGNRLIARGCAGHSERQGASPGGTL
jgi:flagellar protein FliO/FliZ